MVSKLFLQVIQILLGVPLEDIVGVSGEREASAAVRLADILGNVLFHPLDLLPIVPRVLSVSSQSQPSVIHFFRTKKSERNNKIIKNKIILFQ